MSDETDERRAAPSRTGTGAPNPANPPPSSSPAAAAASPNFPASASPSSLLPRLFFLSLSASSTLALTCFLALRSGGRRIPLPPPLLAGRAPLTAACASAGLITILAAGAGAFFAGSVVAGKNCRRGDDENVAREDRTVSSVDRGGCGPTDDGPPCRPDESDRDGMTDPLLPPPPPADGRDEEERSEAAAAAAPTDGGGGGGGTVGREADGAPPPPPAPPGLLDLDAAKGRARTDHALTTLREGIFAFAYVVLTALSFVLGIEAADLGSDGGGDDDDGSGSKSSPGGTTATDVACIGLTLALLQVTFFLTKSILTTVQTSSATLLDLRAVHVHPLRFVSRRYDAYCDICSTSITGGECFRCRLCDFDYCLGCYERGRRVQDWSVLRGDGGVKAGPTVAGGDDGGGPQHAWRRTGVGTMTYLLRSLRLLRPHAPYVALTATCLLINVTCRLFVPNVEGRLFDDLIEGNVHSFLSGVRFLSYYWAGRTVFQSVQRYSARLISRRLRLDLRAKLFDRLLRQDVAFFDATRSGAMVRRVDGDVEDMSRPVPVLVNNVLQSAVLIVGAVTCCLISSARLTVLAAACLGPVSYLTYVSAEWGGSLEGQMVSCEEEGSAVVAEAMANMRNVRALSAEGFESDRYGRVLTRLGGKMHREALGDMVVEILEGALEFLVEVLVLAFGGMAIVNEHADALTVGQLIAFTMYWEMLSDGLETIQDVFSDLAQAAAAAQRVFDLLDVQPDIPLEEGSVLCRQSFRGRIKFENVRFAYQSRPDRRVLDGFNLDVPAGGTCALVGRSGAGKSTLVHLLLRFYDPREGRITIDGVPLTDLNLRAFHELIGFVSQETKLCFGTVRDNLTYGLPWTPAEGEVEAAALAANCSEFIDEMEEGYETNLGEAGVRLSGGQRQRLAIARAFLRRPRLLILDEATSHLDSESEQLVQEGIDRLVESATEPAPLQVEGAPVVHGSGNCTVIVIAHRLSTVRNADVIAVVNEGRVAERGSHDALVARGGIYAKLIAKQAERAAEILPEGEGRRHLAPEFPDVDNLFDTVLGRRESSSSGSSLCSSSDGSN